MKKFLIASMALLATAGVSRANFNLSFNNGSSTVNGADNERVLPLAIDTSTSSASVSGTSNDAGYNAWLGLSGTGTQDDAFSLSMEAGFAFDPINASYDTTDWVGEPPTPAKNAFRFYFKDPDPLGVAPRGLSNNSFDVGEIVHFTISGLEAGQSLVLKGYTLKDNSPGRVDLYYGPGLTVFDTLDAVTDVSAENIVLGNGDQFGFGYNFASGNRSALYSIEFDIVGGSTPVSGDYDDSDQVEQVDLNLVLLNWGDDTGSIVGWVNDAPEAGQPVGNEQLTVVRTNWGNTATGAAAGVVPEPTTAALLAIGMLAGARVRGRRRGWG